MYDAVKDSAIATAIEESSHLEKQFSTTLYGKLCKCKPDIARRPGRILGLLRPEVHGPYLSGHVPTFG